MVPLENFKVLSHSQMIAIQSLAHSLEKISLQDVMRECVGFMFSRVAARRPKTMYIKFTLIIHSDKSITF